ncbi:P-loop containing nucleoside triphosphate hydrolase protein [Triangularia verruculosa]|uniref:P-loop containing nucleoside triphosphate hydrolase protein n=1 Tax=Triangularia verruculosa TaxID=2587418 RepID=A0AAN7AYN2_9PEZI|nr:P-loop containing nucleoside triphosphate hydrolase protein [Triangularia verruculosa]
MFQVMASNGVNSASTRKRVGVKCEVKHLTQKELAHEALMMREDASLHLELLLTYLDNQKWALAERLIEQEIPVITFDLLWYIFRPGDLVYLSENNEPSLFWLLRAGYDQTVIQGIVWKYFKLDCLYQGHYGKKSGMVAKSIKIPERQQFLGNGAEKITGLSQTRIASWEIALYLRRRLFWCLAAANNSGMFMEENPTQRVEAIKWNLAKYQPSSAPEDPTLLCPPYIHGYHLSMRCWCKFSVDKLKNPVWNSEDFGSVLLPDGYGQMIRSLVKHHRYASQTRDEINLKGKGLVIVLHGPPGTGKTRTAGELGSCIYEIQDKLRRLVRYATAWKAILLIDEADVFLECRQASGSVSLERNALVAVFLRQLEYFQGIIFLTSNRAHVFDPAVKSHINIMLYYPSPDRATRKLLWEQKLEPTLKRKPVPECQLDITSAVRELLEYEMSGREISNTVNSALTIANDELRSLNMEHIRAVAKIWKDSQEKSTQTEIAVNDTIRETEWIPSILDGLKGLGISFWVWKLVGPATLAAILFQGLLRLWKMKLRWQSRRH